MPKCADSGALAMREDEEPLEEADAVEEDEEDVEGLSPHIDPHISPITRCTHGCIIRSTRNHDRG